jgi:hypothetical protein
MRAFAVGKSDKQIRMELRIPLQSFYRLLRDLRDKTGTCDRIGLLEWAMWKRRCDVSRKSESSA